MHLSISASSSSAPDREASMCEYVWIPISCSTVESRMRE